jgi:hypothetical protein
VSADNTSACLGGFHGPGRLLLVSCPALNPLGNWRLSGFRVHSGYTLEGFWAAFGLLGRAAA